MKKTFLIMYLLIAVHLSLTACPLCQQQQPKLLQGITHGTGPQSNWDYIIVMSAVLIVLVTLFYTVKWIIKPGEKNNNHIKRTILS